MIAKDTHKKAVMYCKAHIRLSLTSVALCESKSQQRVDLNRYSKIGRALQIKHGDKFKVTIERIDKFP